MVPNLGDPLMVGLTYTNSKTLNPTYHRHRHSTQYSVPTNHRANRHGATVPDHGDPLMVGLTYPKP